MVVGVSPKTPCVLDSTAQRSWVARKRSTIPGRCSGEAWSVSNSDPVATATTGWSCCRRRLQWRGGNRKEINECPKDKDSIQTGDDHLQLSDAELSFFWKLWLLFVFVHRVTAEGIVALDDDAVEADGAL